MFPYIQYDLDTTTSTDINKAYINIDIYPHGDSKHYNDIFTWITYVVVKHDITHIHTHTYTCTDKPDKHIYIIHMCIHTQWRSQTRALGPVPYHHWLSKSHVIL